jgi:hypothetical protein
MELELSNPELFGGSNTDATKPRKSRIAASTSLKANKDTKSLDYNKYRHIEELDITENKSIKDVSMFKNLKVIYANYSSLSNIKGLSLVKLHIANNCNIPAINIPTLKELNISGTSCVTSTINAPNLEVLIAYGNQNITNDTIKNFSNLRDLDISYTKVTEISHLNNLENLFANGNVKIVEFPKNLRFISWKRNPNDIEKQIEELEYLEDIEYE